MSHGMFVCVNNDTAMNIQEKVDGVVGVRASAFVVLEEDIRSVGLGTSPSTLIGVVRRDV
jgi:hypothetical protein